MTAAETIAELQRSGKLPAGLSRDQLAQLARALAKYSGEVSQRVLEKILDDFKAKIQQAQSATTPAVQQGTIYRLGEFAAPELADSIRFALKISQEVASGAGVFLNQNLSPGTVEKFPALEFKRLYDREVPRGLRKGKGGALIEVPDEDWPTRWQAAGESLGEDESWLPWDADAQDGSGIALKSSGIWQALGDGVGGYDDTLGNPFPPFAFNSGFRTLDVDRTRAEALGLIGPEDEAKPAALDFSKLFAEVGE